jgi:hypothetical protein
MLFRRFPTFRIQLKSSSQYHQWVFGIDVFLYVITRSILLDFFLLPVTCYVLGFPTGNPSWSDHHQVQSNIEYDRTGFVLPLGYTSLNRTSFGMNTGLHRNNTTPNDQ